MKLKDIFSKEAICPSMKASDKKEVLEEISEQIEKAYSELKKEDVLKVLLEREKLGSTGIGNGVAIPHGKITGLSSIVAFFGRSQKGIDFQSHDHKLSRLFFVLLAPENVIGSHLQALARLSRILKGDHVRSRLLESKDQDLYKVLIEEDEKL